MLRIMSLLNINKMQTGVFMYRFKHRLLPESFANNFQLNTDVHCYYTRSYNKYHKVYARTKTRQFSISYRGPCVWNSLPIPLTIVPTLGTFTMKLKQYLIEMEKINCNGCRNTTDDTMAATDHLYLYLENLGKWGSLAAEH